MEKISVVIPCYNEEETVALFYNEMERVRRAELANVEFEYIYVDDGSSDKTIELIKNLRTDDKKVRYISFSRNFGKEAAIMAGLNAAVGDYVAVMDSDLQDPPFMLPEMYRAIKEEGFDQVGTRRVTRKGEPPLRTFFARAFYKIINRLSNVEMTDGARDFRLMKRCVVNAILSLPEKNRYSKGIFSYVGFKTKWLPFENVERAAGTSKWSFSALFEYAVSGIASFSTVPLLFPFFMGLIFYVLSIAFLISAIAADSLVLAVCTVGFFTSGTVLIAIAILCRYVAQNSVEIKNRPMYIIRETEDNIK